MELQNKKYGRLTIVKKSHSVYGIMWECLCDCGNITYVRTGHLNSGSVKSCGCLLKESQNSLKIHGQYYNDIYPVWLDMKRRCYDQNRKDYVNYGGRGIKVCDRWLNNVVIFIKDTGARPKGYTLERINTNGDYEPSNCKWASKAEQNRNSRHSKRWMIKGEIFDSASLAGEAFNVSHATIVRWCQNPNKPDCISERIY